MLHAGGRGGAWARGSHSVPSLACWVALGGFRPLPGPHVRCRRPHPCCLLSLYGRTAVSRGSRGSPGSLPSSHRGCLCAPPAAFSASPARGHSATGLAVAAPHLTCSWIPLTSEPLHGAAHRPAGRLWDPPFLGSITLPGSSGVTPALAPPPKLPAASASLLPPEGPSASCAVRPPPTPCWAAPLEWVSCPLSTLQTGPRASNRHKRRNPMSRLIVEINSGN